MTRDFNENVIDTLGSKPIKTYKGFKRGYWVTDYSNGYQLMHMGKVLPVTSDQVYACREIPSLVIEKL